jgi:hypothetical protein
MNYIIALTLILVACGKDEEAVSTRDTERPVLTEKQADENVSFYAATDADVPACTSKNTGILVYVESTQTFRACQASGYVTVQIKGKDGVSGSNGKDAPVMQQNQWIDSITGNTWLFASSGSQGTASSTCVGDYRLAQVAELQAACYSGIFSVYTQKMGSLPYPQAWTGNGGYFISTACTSGTQSTGTQSTLICIKK